MFELTLRRLIEGFFEEIPGETPVKTSDEKTGGVSNGTPE